MIIDADNITDFVTGDALTASDLDTTIGEIVEKFDAMLETATGHSHDGTDSRALATGFMGLSVEEWAIATAGGLWE